MVCRWHSTCQPMSDNRNKTTQSCMAQRVKAQVTPSLNAQPLAAAWGRLCTLCVSVSLKLHCASRPANCELYSSCVNRQQSAIQQHHASRQLPAAIRTYSVSGQLCFSSCGNRHSRQYSNTTNRVSCQQQYERIVS